MFKDKLTDIFPDFANSIRKRVRSSRDWRMGWRFVGKSR